MLKCAMNLDKNQEMFSNFMSYMKSPIYIIFIDTVTETF